MSNETKDTIVNFCKTTTETMTSYIREKYQVPKFTMKLTLDFSQRRTTSWGGIKKGSPFINLVLKRYVAYTSPECSDMKMSFDEYSNFNTDPVIGSISGTWQTCLTALIAHEVAHAVQYFSRLDSSIKLPFTVKKDSKEEKGHGVLWKAIYSDLRIQFVNAGASSVPVKQGEVKKFIVVEPIAKTISKTTTTSSGGWHVGPYQSKNGGTFIHYYKDSDNSLIGTLFKKAGNVWKFDYSSKTYISCETATLGEARKKAFGF